MTDVLRFPPYEAWNRPLSQLGRSQPQTLQRGKSRCYLNRDIVDYYNTHQISILTLVTYSTALCFGMMTLKISRSSTQY